MKVNTLARKTQEENEREKRHRILAREIAEEGIVLLKNEAETLPVNPGKLALYGAGASKTIIGGTGSGEVNARRVVNVRQGLEQAGYEITTGRWLTEYEEEFKKQQELFAAEMKSAIFKVRSGADANNILGRSFLYPAGRAVTEQDVTESGTDTCIYVVSRQSGEGADRKVEDFGLTPEEISQIKFLAEHYAKCILIINSGCTMDISSVADLPGLKSIVFMCQLGEESGSALANVISGRVSPSGHVSDTWVQHYSDVPCGDTFSYMSPKDTEQNYEEGLFVGYRYYDAARIKPRYAFGFGLSYTTFSMKTKRVHVEGSTVSAEVAVKNTGSRCSGKQVVQLYLTCPDGALLKPYQQLAAYEKTGVLAPGASETVTLSFDLRGQASYDEAAASYILEKGDYVIRIGDASDNTTAAAVLVLDETVVTENAKTIERNRPAVKELALTSDKNNVPSGTERISLRAADIQPITHDFSYRPETDEKVQSILKKLSTDECIDLVLGSGMSFYTFQADFIVPGNAANTTSKLVRKGVPSVSLCDGPAGLRMLRESVAYRNGKVKALTNVISVFDYLPSALTSRLLGKAEKGTVLYQYATAFPVGNAIAQTWNRGLAEQFGRAVSVEMTEYGCTFWLAPGMNIHRNPLCGRNFEYYSEDPILAGTIAAAVCRGVGSTPGNYVTIKHFCCNNQEFLRNTASSNVNERTLREIYLRPFKLAITEGGAKAVMSSYNRVNGTYVVENRTLLEDFLRGECGFDGVVMTDWTATSKKLASAVKAMAAGNDMLMPGMGGDRKALTAGIKDGSLKEADLRKSAARALKSILNAARVQ